MRGRKGRWTGNEQLNHGQAEKQVGAEFSFAHQVAQGFVGGGDQSDIETYRRG